MTLKKSLKNSALIFGIFAIGMFSLPVANLFGGYYSVVAVVIAVLATAFISDILDKNSLKENLVEVIFIAVLFLFEFVFLIANDIFGHPVYVKSNLGFFGICVIISQLYSAGMICYYLISIVISMYSNKHHVEIIEKIDKNEESVIEEEIDVGELNSDEVQELKKLPQNEEKKEAPFMEEIK